MNPWRRLLLSSYYHASLPLRQRAARRRAATGQTPVCVLFYHRIADSQPNDWTMSTDVFRRQIEWLTRRFDVVSLEEGQRRIASGANKRPTVCITFDDGYADNSAFAWPYLVGERIPFTYFVATRAIIEQRPFPHDVEAGTPLQPNTVEGLRWLAAQGVEIGAHTRTHADLGASIEPAFLYEEIEGSKRDLEDLLGRRVRYFAFPYGLQENMTREAVDVAREVGFRGICSAYGGYNFPGDDEFHLNRFHADPELLRFKNWLTIDPRKSQSVNQLARRTSDLAGAAEQAIESEIREASIHDEPLAAGGRRGY